MNDDICDKYIAALRSGRYLPIKAWMRRMDPTTGELRHCALGVLYDVLDPDGWQPIRSGKHGCPDHCYVPRDATAARRVLSADDELSICRIFDRTLSFTLVADLVAELRMVRLAGLEPAATGLPDRGSGH